jgi:hypothetical protein
MPTLHTRIIFVLTQFSDPCRASIFRQLFCQFGVVHWRPGSTPAFWISRRPSLCAPEAGFCNKYGSSWCSQPSPSHSLDLSLHTSPPPVSHLRSSADRNLHCLMPAHCEQASQRVAVTTQARSLRAHTLHGTALAPSGGPHARSGGSAVMQRAARARIRVPSRGPPLRGGQLSSRASF